MYSVVGLEGGKLASGSKDCTIRIWDVAKGECERVLKGHTGDVMSVASVGEGRVASCSDDRRVRIWGPTEGSAPSVCVIS